MRLLFLLILAGTGWAREVRVGVYENLPKVGLSPQGRPQGIFVEVLEAIADREGWKVRYVPGTWAEGLQRLQRGEIDLMPDVAPTPARETLFSFHGEPVLSDWFQVFARKNSRIRSVVDLDGKTVAVLQGSIQEEALRSMVEGFGLRLQVLPVPDYQTGFHAVADGRADAVVTNRFYGAWHAKRWHVEDTAVIFHPGGLYFATARGRNQDLLEAIDRHLRKLKGDEGSAYVRALQRWAPVPPLVTRPRWLGPAVAGAAGVVVLSLSVAWVLRSRVRARTGELEELKLHTQVTEEALRETEDTYRLLFQTANDAILLLFEGRVVDCNPQALAMFGRSRGELVGSFLWDLSPPLQPDGAPSMDAALERLGGASSGPAQRFEWECRRGDGRTFSAEVSLAPVELGGEPHLLAIVHDITHRKEAERALRELNQELERRVAERTAELAQARDKALAAERLKSAFLATMSHELRTPLNSIIGFTGVLLQELPGPLNQEQRTQLSIVRDSARHLLALINDVLDISKLEAGQLEIRREAFHLPTSLRKVLSLVQPMAQAKGVACVGIWDEALGIMVGDARRVEQVLLNLLTNAVKFTDRGSVTLHASADGTRLRVEVRDTGVGIREEDIPHLFAPFRQIDAGLTRRHEGTGLGLAISKRLVELMGGTIGVVSTYGSGSTFWIELPLGGGGPEGIPPGSEPVRAEEAP